MMALKQTSICTSINAANPMEELKTTNFERTTEVSKIIGKSQTITYVLKAVARSHTDFSHFTKLILRLLL